MSECPGKGPEGKHIGCCGYDELATKPATTRPFSASDIGRPRVAVKSEKKEIEGRPRIQVKAVAVEEQASSKPIPTQIGSGRVSGGNTANIFNQARAVNQATERPRVIAMAMGQTQVEPLPSPKVEAVLRRESLPQGLTKSEAQILASDLQDAIEKTELALSEGKQCFDMDQGVLENVRRIQSGLLDFSMDAPDSERVELDPEDLSMIERVFECGSAYEKERQARSAAAMAFVAGGLVIGAIVLVVVS